MLKIATVAGLLLAYLLAHLPDAPQLDDWVIGLQSKEGTPCCEGNEAHALNEPDWKVSPEGHYQVFIEGDWHDVPDSAVVQGPNKYGRVLVWYVTYTPTSTVYIRCFLPAAGA